jgi:hypothetical protein
VRAEGQRKKEIAFTLCEILLQPLPQVAFIWRLL